MDFGVFVPGGADGVFGPATKTAVSHFQRWNGLAVTGEVDETTAARLRLGSAPAAPAGPAAVAGPGTTAVTGDTFVGMTIGARGDNVKVLQRALIAAGITVRGGADGVFGPATAAALTTYQQANGLTANGVVDEAWSPRSRWSPAFPHRQPRRPWRNQQRAPRTSVSRSARPAPWSRTCNEHSCRPA